MPTILETLRGVNAYPLPLRTLAETAEARGLDLHAEVSPSVLQAKAYRLAKADLLLWLSLAPNVAQGGQSYSFSDEQRKELRQQARTIYDELEPEKNAGCVTFGYKGDRL